MKVKKLRHEQPLDVQLSRDILVSSSEKGRARGNRDKYQQRQQLRDGVAEDTIIDEKILEEARLQMEEIKKEQLDTESLMNDCITSENAQDIDDDDDDENLEKDYQGEEDYDQDLQDWENEINELSEADKKALDVFMPSSTNSRSLADVITEKYKLQQQQQSESDTIGTAPAVPKYLNEKVVEVYTKVGILLTRYKSGKIPKAFKIIPSLNNWEDVLYLTNPHEWTPHSTYQATRIFISNLKPKEAQKFLELVLLDAVRRDIKETKKLNYHLYMALKKALYKPAAFFKGILFKLVSDGCTLREAVIIGSVLKKISIPLLHSSAALMKLVDMEYSGATSIFIRTLLDKRYALPYRVLDNVVFHFLKFSNNTEVKLPVLWHQSLLVFAQRYKDDLATDQKEALLELLKKQSHDSITPEIRRELLASKGLRMESEPTLPRTSAEAMASMVLEKKL